jgi:hypothetical protein
MAASCIGAFGRSKNVEILHAVRLGSVVIMMAAAVSPALAEIAGPSSRSLLLDGLNAIAAAGHPDQLGVMTIWSGNKFVQCRRLAEGTLRCEAAGSLMQPSLHSVLTPDRVAALVALGWHLDLSFGNYVQDFAPGSEIRPVADAVMNALARGYRADMPRLEVGVKWIKDDACPPRSGFTQNLAGSINDSPEMAAVAVHGCAYKPDATSQAAALPAASAAASPEDVANAYAVLVFRQVQRTLSAKSAHPFFNLSPGDHIGYVQCAPDHGGLYCEAQSVESWQGLVGVLTLERVAALHQAGFADPGYSQNYSRNFSAQEAADPAIAYKLLRVLTDSYGFGGYPSLEINTGDPTP